MPWSNQSGGGGPWGQGGGSGGGGPWGSAPKGGGGGPPDLEEILRRGQDRLKTIIPGGAAFGGKTAAVVLLAAIVLWLATGFYTVRPNEVGINMIFGAYTGSTGEGLRYNLPYPIGRIEKPDVTAQQRVEVGYRSAPGQGRAREDRKSTRLNSSHTVISYAVFCL